MKKILQTCFAVFALFAISSCKQDKDVGQPQPEPEYSVFGTYRGTFTTYTTYYLYIDGDTTVKHFNNSEPGVITFKDSADSVVMDRRSGNTFYYFPNKFPYAGYSYHLLPSMGGVRNIEFIPKENRVTLYDSIYEKTFYGYPEDVQYYYDLVTVTTFTGTR